jgi:hypothetical protein
VSAPTLVKSSPSGFFDFACKASSDVCRWGDYAAATPDPAAPTTSATGLVWNTSQWVSGQSTSAAVWHTQNFVIRP